MSTSEICIVQRSIEDQKYKIQIKDLVLKSVTALISNLEGGLLLNHAQPIGFV